MLELREVVKHYDSPGGETIRAIDGISLAVDRGDLVAIYGPSGSGKSTLLKLAAGLLKPDSGAVLVGGRDVTRLEGRDLADFQRLELGFVQQSLHLLPGVTAIDNALLKLLDSSVSWREARRTVTPLLVQLGLEKRLQHRAEELSMGERQRVLVARALSTNPTLVLADEPTGSLDQRRGREVFELLIDLCRQRAVAMVLATHDPRAAGVATRTLALDDGRLVAYDESLDGVG